MRLDKLSIGTTHHRHEFFDFAALLGLVARRDGMIDAMRDVITQDLLLDAAQRRAHRRDLCDDVDAIAVVVHHAGETANLTLDTAQAFRTRRLDVVSHDVYIPPMGM
jgi:hypothetical protein